MMILRIYTKFNNNASLGGPLAPAEACFARRERALIKGDTPKMQSILGGKEF